MTDLFIQTTVRQTSEGSMRKVQLYWRGGLLSAFTYGVPLAYFALEFHSSPEDERGTFAEATFRDNKWTLTPLWEDQCGAFPEVPEKVLELLQNNLLAAV